MRTRMVFAVVLGVAAIVAACGGGSGLTGKTWQLTAITEKVPAFQGVVPAADQQNYTITFEPNGNFTAKADCNQLAGSYTTTGSGGLTMALGPMTLVACPEGSLADQYVAALGKSESYVVANGQLTITTTDGGTLTFK